jgi:hypothetical protein
MKKFQIKYQDGFNILLETVEANNTLEARLIFYMGFPCVDILDISEIGGD